MATPFRQTWDLESIFPGGSKSPDLATHLGALEDDLKRLQQRVSGLPDLTSPEAVTEWHAALMLLQTLMDSVVQGTAFLSCLAAQNVKDAEARLLHGRMAQMGAMLGAVDIEMRDRIQKLPEETWQSVLADERFQPLAFPLQEARERGAEQMPKEREALANDLAPDGYHAWGQLYDTIAGRVTVHVDGVPLSAGQAYNKFADPDPGRRAALFAQWEKAWAGEAELCASALNHLAGYRLALYRHRGWDSVLKEPLDENRMSAATLNAMWEAVEAGKAPLVAYLERKARLMGTGAFHWYDELAPLGRTARQVPYGEAAAFIAQHFGRFSPQMAAFANRAFQEGWIESEDRPGKMPGGFCTPLPLSRQCRIFLTYGGNALGVGALAHELGHAFHNHVMWEIPPMARYYPMSLGETASTFAERIVKRAAAQAAPTAEERLALLDSSIREAVVMFMNIHSRFLFETRFYEARRHSMLSVDQLNELMVQAQREAFCDSLASYCPYLWATKGHFYRTGAPFYNFPYTFGYLFSTGIYARVEQEGPAFEQRYIDLLRDTGRMRVEDLAARHMGVDLTRRTFWDSAVNAALREVHEFLDLTRDI